MSRSSNPKIHDNSSNIWQKYPEAIVKDLVLNIHKAKGENNCISLETK